MQTKFSLPNDSEEKTDRESSPKKPIGRRKSIAVIQGLPSITEYQDNSRRSLRNQKSFSQLNSISETSDVPVHTSRKYSVDATLATTDRRASLAARRESFVSKNFSSSLDGREPWNSTKRTSFSRRLSSNGLFPPVPGLGKRTSFGTIGRRVATLLRAKNAFSNIRRKEDEIDGGNVDDAEFEIKELPRNPRFASTLSPEAQYAMMKGYEDVVYSCLVSSNPEYRPFLKRNKTPSSLCIPDDTVRVSKTPTPTVDTDNTESKADENHDEHETDKTMPSNQETAVHHRIHEERRAVAHSIKDEAHQQRVKQHNIYKAQKERQLVMTYRYQSAMDILDGIRKSKGLHSLSPRVVDKRGDYVPIKEFNSWTGVWNKEFERNKKIHAKI